MPYPSPPVLQTSYTAFQQGQGDNGFPGTQLDADLVNLRDAVTSVNMFLRQIQRSDGRLGNASVGVEQLEPGLLIGIEQPTGWEAATAYAIGETVFADLGYYIAKLAHTSTVFADDLASGRWLLLIDFAPFVQQGIDDAIAAGVPTLAGENAFTSPNAFSEGALEKTFGLAANVLSIADLRTLTPYVGKPALLTDGRSGGLYYYDETVDAATYGADVEELVLIPHDSPNDGAWVSVYGDPRMSAWADNGSFPARRGRFASGIHTGNNAVKFLGGLTAANADSEFWANDVPTSNVGGGGGWYCNNARNLFERDGGFQNTVIVSRSAANNVGSTIGLSVIAVGRNTDSTGGLWTYYGEAIAESGEAGHLRCGEFAVINKSGPIANTGGEKPYTNTVQGLRFVFAFAVGGGESIHGDTSADPVDTILRFNATGGKAYSVFNIRSNTLYVDGDGESRLMQMPNAASLIWYRTGDERTLEILSKVASTNTFLPYRIVTDEDQGIWFKFQGSTRTMLQLMPAGGAVNYLRITPSSAGNPIILTALGDDAAINIDLRPKGTGVINSTRPFARDGTQLLTTQRTGWGAPTGTAARSTFATTTVTTEQLAQRVKALIDDLTTHGLIGA